MAGEKLVAQLGGYIYLGADACPTLRIPVESADLASAIFQYRDQNGIGASDMKSGCGNIFANDGTLVARVSYNGRIWNAHGEFLQEATARNAQAPPDGSDTLTKGCTLIGGADKWHQNGKFVSGWTRCQNDAEIGVDEVTFGLQVIESEAYLPVGVYEPEENEEANAFLERVKEAERRRQGT